MSDSLGLVRSSTRLPRDPNQFTVRRASRFSTSPYSSMMSGNPSVPVRKPAFVNLCDPCAFAEVLLSAYRHRFAPGTVSQDRVRGIFVIGDPKKQTIVIVRHTVRFCVRNCGVSMADVAAALRDRCSGTANGHEADCVIAWWTNGAILCGGAPCVTDVRLQQDATIAVSVLPVAPGDPLVVYNGTLQIDWKGDTTDQRSVLFMVKQPAFNDKVYETSDGARVRAYVSQSDRTTLTLQTVNTGLLIARATLEQDVPDQWVYRVEVFVYGVTCATTSPADALAPLTFEAVTACGEQSKAATLWLPLSAPFA